MRKLEHQIHEIIIEVPWIVAYVNTFAIRSISDLW